MRGLTPVAGAPSTWWRGYQDCMNEAGAPCPYAVGTYAARQWRFGWLAAWGDLHPQPTDLTEQGLACGDPLGVLDSTDEEAMR